MNKHQVIVPKESVQPYLARGYARSDETPESLMDLSEETRAGLVVLEIDLEQHVQLNSNPRRYGVHFETGYYATDIETRIYEVLQEEGKLTVAALAEVDTPPNYLTTDSLFATAQEAALSAVAEVRDAIAMHRRAITNLEAFLRRYT